MSAYEPTQCPKCGSDGNEPIRKEIRELGSDGIFYLDGDYYQCWYCGELWAQLTLQKRKAVAEQKDRKV